MIRSNSSHKIDQNGFLNVENFVINLIHIPVLILGYNYMFYYKDKKCDLIQITLYMNKNINSEHKKILPCLK